MELGGVIPTSRPPVPRGKTRYLLYKRLGGPQGRTGQTENLVTTGIRSRTVHPVVSRYTGYATRPTMHGILNYQDSTSHLGSLRLYTTVCLHTKYVMSFVQVVNEQPLECRYYNEALVTGVMDDN